METIEKKANNINILYILRVFLSYWPWFVLSCGIFLIVGMLYLRFSTRTYSVSARILIKSERMNTRSSDTYVNVNALMNQEKNLSNEVNYMRSSPLIKEVIKDMNLLTSYYYKEDKIPIGSNFGLHNMYNRSPFTVIVDKNSPQPLNSLFYIEILNDNQFKIHAEAEEAYLYNFEDESSSDYSFYFYLDGVYEFGEKIQNDDCSFSIILNSNYDAEMYEDKDLYFRFNSPQELAYRFQDALSISSNFYQSSIANLTFESENLELSKEFLSKLIDIYIQNNIDEKNYEANNTIEYIEEQLANISVDLNQSEQQLQNFRNTKEVMNIDEKYREILAEIRELENRRDELQSEIQNLNRLKTYFENNKDSKTFIAPSFTGMSDETLSTLIQELTNLSRERQELISTNQLKNPRIKTLEANMSSILKVITDNINFTLATAQSDLEEVNQKIDQLNARYSDLPQTQRELLELERQFSINNEVYTALMNRRIQAKLIKASNRPDVEVIEPVRYDMVTSPSIKKIAAVFLFLGFFFPSVYIVIVNFLTPKIRTKEELFNFCNLPSIGDIPRNEKPDQPNVVTNFPHTPIVERFHILRTNLIYNLYGKTNKAILVTSTIPNEGKSFISLNLALSFASANHKTLLIAFDLRKNSKTLSKLRMNTLVGLDSYLIDKANVEDIISETEYPNLDFISNGQIPPNPTGLLSSPRLSELFEIVKTNYDYIIIDTPPFGLVTDAFMLMKQSDINVYVSRLGVVTKKALKQSMAELNAKNLENVHLLKNDITKIEKTYYAKYSYREDDTKKRKFLRFFRAKKKSKEPVIS